MFLDRFNYFQGLYQAPAFFVAIATCVALVACGGGGGGGSSSAPGTGAGSTVSKPAELSLVVGNIQSFNGTGANARLAEPHGIAIDSVGNTYITERGLHSVRKISPAGVVSVFVGDAFDSGFADGSGAAVRFKNPGDIAIDKDDNIYVLDTGNYTVRKVSPAGLVTTLAGSPGQTGSIDGKGTAARFNQLFSISVDPSGGLFVWEPGVNAALRKIAVDGTVSTLSVPVDTFRLDVHMAADTGGNLFVASGTARDYPSEGAIASTPRAYVLHKLTPAGVLTQIYQFSDKDVEGQIVNFGGIAVDSVGNIYMGNGKRWDQTSPLYRYESIGGTVLKLSPQGVLTTIAGTRGQAGSDDGQGLNASFNVPGKLAIDRQGNLAVANVSDRTIRTISKSGVVSTLAGRASASIDGQGDKGQLKDVVGLASDQRGNVVVAERSTLRSLSPSGILTTTRKDPIGGFRNLALDSRGFMYVSIIAGQQGASYRDTAQFAPNGMKTGKEYGLFDNLAVDAQDNLYASRFSSPRSIANLTTGKTFAEMEPWSLHAYTFDSIGNAYATDLSQSVILKISPSGTVSILAGMADKPGYKDGSAGSARFNGPSGIAVLGTDVYVSDTGNGLIRKISQDGVVTTIAGSLGSVDTVMGQGGSLYLPTYLATESSNSLLVVVDGKAIVRIRLQ